MEEGVGGQDVVEGLSAALRVDAVADVGELAEHVEAVELQEQVAVHESLCDAGVPDEFVGVHCHVAIASARVHGQVCGELEVPWQFNLSGETVVEVKDIDSREVCPSAGGTLIVEVAFCREVELVGRLPRERKLVVEVVGGHDASGIVHQVNAVTVSVGKILLEAQTLFVVEREVNAGRSIGVPVAVDVLRRTCPHACLLVVEHGCGDSVLCGIETERGIDQCATQLLAIVAVDAVAARRAKIGVAELDVERVAVGADIEQAAHGWLRDVRLIATPYVPVGFMMGVREVQACRQTGGAAAHCGIDLCALPVVERLMDDGQREAGVEVVRCPC